MTPDARRRIRRIALAADESSAGPKKKAPVREPEGDRPVGAEWTGDA